VEKESSKIDPKRRKVPRLEKEEYYKGKQDPPSRGCKVLQNQRREGRKICVDGTRRVPLELC